MALSPPHQDRWTAPSPPPPPQPLRGSGCACLPRASGQCARPQPQPWGGRATCPPSPGRRRCGPAASAAGAAGCAAAAGDTGSTGRCTARGRHAGRPGGRLAAAPRPVSGSCSAGSVRRQGRVREDCPASGGHRACPHDPSPGGVRPRRRRAGPGPGSDVCGDDPRPTRPAPGGSGCRGGLQWACLCASPSRFLASCPWGPGSRQLCRPEPACPGLRHAAPADRPWSRPHAPRLHRGLGSAHAVPGPKSRQAWEPRARATGLRGHGGKAPGANTWGPRRRTQRRHARGRLRNGSATCVRRPPAGQAPAPAPDSAVGDRRDLPRERRASGSPTAAQGHA